MLILPMPIGWYLLRMYNLQLLELAEIRRDAVEPRYNEPLYNEVPGITMDILHPDLSYSKKKCMEQNPDITNPRYNEPISLALSTLLNRGSTVFVLPGQWDIFTIFDQHKES